MNNHRGRGLLVMSVLAMLSWGCLLFSESQPNSQDEQDLAGFEETLAAEIDGELGEGTPEPPSPEAEYKEDPIQAKAVEGLGELYRLKVPVDWNGESGEDRQEWCAGNPSDGCISIEIRIKQASAERLLDDYLAGLQENVTGYQELKKSAVEVGGLIGQRAEVTYVWREKEERSFIVGLVYNRVGLLISGFSAPEMFDPHRDEFDLALTSFEWIDYPDALPYEQWGVYEEDSLTFSYLTDSWIAGDIAEIAADHAAAYEEVVSRLGVGANGPRVHLILYPSETALFHSTAREAGFAITDLNEVHAIWTAPDDHQSLGHEMTHVIAFHAMGDAQEALLGEGLAVCLDQSGRDFRAEGQTLVETKQYLPFDRLVGDVWFEQDPGLAYLQSGSVVCYLFDRYGADGVKNLYLKPLETGLGEVLGISLEQLQQDWIEWAQGSPLGE